LCGSGTKTEGVSVNSFIFGLVFLDLRPVSLPLFLHLINTRRPDVPLTSSSLLTTALCGIILANASHLLSVFVLYRLALALPLGKKENASQFAFVAATLHVVSPAGLFLSAPYGESTFSLLNFLGQLFYVSSYRNSPRSYHIRNDILLVLSGICFGVSATVRGNGLLSGILLLHDACLWAGLVLGRMGVPILSISIIPAICRDAIEDFPSRRMPATIIAGLLVAIGFATPQYVAWQDYCGTGVRSKRPWCDSLPPSIFGWVQSNYWLVKVYVPTDGHRLTRAGTLGF
jgi:phosphatidylinositol glycan class V